MTPGTCACSPSSPRSGRPCLRRWVRLGSVLTRFGGYATRFGAAPARVRAGQFEWINGTAVDSCHRVWFALHEDLVATVGIDRAAEPAES